MHRNFLAGLKAFMTRDFPLQPTLACFAFVMALSTPVQAIQTVQTFYVPIPEEHFRLYANAQTADADASWEEDLVRSVVSITATFNSTIIYYDQWEDGYEYDITAPSQSTTQVWGDNNPTNGIPPGFATDIINAGDVIALPDTPGTNDVPIVRVGGLAFRDQGNHYYDGRDKIACTEQLVVTHAMWPVGPPGTLGAMLAGAVEAFDTSKWGSSYTVPVGQNIGQVGFNWVSLSIMAQKDGTVVAVDADGPGAGAAVNYALNQGEVAYVTTIQRGATVTSTGGPVQVNMMTCRAPSNANGRLYPLLPTTSWGNTYYNPVPTTVEGGGTVVTNSVILFNPGAGPITVDRTVVGGGTTNIIVPAGTHMIDSMPQNTGARYQSTLAEPFYAIAAIDMNGNVHNWGFTMIDRDQITPAAVVGWAPGTTDLQRDASPVWVTPDSATTVYVDYDGNSTTGLLCCDSNGNRYDISYNLAAFASQRIFSPGPAGSFDHTGYRIYTTNNAKIAVAWGQDGANSSGSQPTEFDLGTTVLPYPSITAYKSAAIIGDYNGNGSMDAGEVLEYTIRVYNSGILPISNITLNDVLDANITYVANTTTLDGVAIPDDGSGTRFPLDSPGYNLTTPATLTPGQSVYFVFQVQAVNPLVVTTINNTARVNSVAEIFANVLVTSAAEGGLQTTKTSTLPNNPLLPGDIVSYRVDVTNTSSTPLTGITLTDPLPAGTDYVAGSTIAVGPSQKYVLDRFDVLSYDAQDGPNRWTSNWLEVDAAGAAQSPTAGNVQVTNGELRLKDPAGGAGSSAARTVDLSVYAAGLAYLRFNYRTNPYVQAADTVIVEMSNTGGAPYATVATLTGFTGALTGSRTIDVSAYISATTTVRFRVSVGYGINVAQKYFYVDQVQIRAVGGTKTALDQFSTGDYTGGSNWVGSWVETDNAGAAQSPVAGNVRVTANTLEFQTRTAVAVVGNAATRRLFVDGVVGATLSFAVTVVNAPTGTVSAEISKDGTNYTVLGTFNAAATPTYDISAYLSGATTLRFRVASVATNQDRYVRFDNVQVVAGKQQPRTLDNVSGGVNPDLVDGVPSVLTTGRDGIALAPGETLRVDYQVQLKVPPNVTRVVNLVTVESFERTPPVTARTVDPVLEGGSIGNLVWLDSNNNGTYNVGEQGLVNVVVWLDLDNDGVIDAGEPQTRTGARGDYIFAGLVPGTYRVRVDTATIPSGLVISGGTNPSVPVTITVLSEFVDTIDFGYKPAAGTALIGNYVWSDADSDGAQDIGEVGISGVLMALSSGNGVDGQPCTADDTLVGGPVSPATTGPDGTYYFTGVAPASYRVCADVGADGVPQSGDETLLPPSFTITNGPQSAGHLYSGLVTVVANEIRTNVDFGFHNDAYKSVTDRVWFDADNDGAWDAGEPGIAGVTVNLQNVSNTVRGSAFTNADGFVSFSGIAPDDYTLMIEDSSGKLLGFSGTSAAAVARELAVTVVASDITGAHFGYNKPGNIGNQVWSDANSNGVQDPGEAGIKGVTVELYLDFNGNGLLDVGTDTFIASTTTDDAGRYLFNVSTPARYFVSIPAQAALTGYSLTTGDPDPASGHQKRIPLYNLLLSDLSADFGYKADASFHAISGAVFEDSDQDGTYDTPPEVGIGGITIDLLQGGVVIASMVTAGDGTYSFPDLPDGTYTVRVTDTAMVLDDWDQTSPALPAPPERTVTLSGADSGGNNFGFYKTPTRVFLAGLTAAGTADGVLVTWETTAEIDTAGYYLKRLEDGMKIAVNTDIVPALLESSSGGTYMILDPGAVGPRLHYELIEVLKQGAPVVYGPFAVRVQPRAALPQAATDNGADERSFGRLPSAQSASAAADLPAGQLYSRKPRPISRRAANLPGDDSGNSVRARALPPAGATGSDVRITVPREGIYRVSAAEIAPLLGLNVKKTRTMIASGRIDLTTKSSSVAYLPVNRGKSLLFYDQGTDTVFSGESVYWIAPGKGRLVRGRRNTQTRSAPDLASFTDSAHAEENRMPLTGSAIDPRADYWLWDYLVAGNATLGRKSFPLVTPGSTGTGAASLAVVLRGATDTPVDPEHHVVIRMNGASIGEGRWNGLDPLVLTLPFEQNLLVDGNNIVEVEAVRDAGIPYSIFYLDAIDVAYHRKYLAVGDRITIRGDGNPTVSVSGFTSPAIRIFNIADPHAPEFVKEARIEGTAGTYQATFRPATADTPYLLVAKTAISGVAALTPWVSAGLLDPLNAADYLIITGAEMTDAAERLAAYRRLEGLTARVVTVGSVMDEFNDGVYDPDAIRRFITYARNSWATPPRYLLLAGDGSFDYRNYLGHDECVVPPAMVSTPRGLFASDTWFADEDDDHVPSLAIGRIPAKTAAELESVVDKIIAYETAPAPPAQAVLYAADQPDSGGDFTTDSNALLDLVPPRYGRTTAYLSELSLTDARNTLVTGIASGITQVNYFGHAGYDRLADEGLLLTADVPALGSGTALPLFTLFTCLAGSFSDPGYVNLGEALLLQTDGGAAALLASSGLSLHDRSRRLAQEFTVLRHSGTAARLGDLVLESLRSYGAVYGGDYTLGSYGILGDPALVLR